jgi:antitoxin component HigA of HigAB toxin-antitoxin module
MVQKAKKTLKQSKKKTITEKQYKEAKTRIEELLHLVDEYTLKSDPNLIELDNLSRIVEAYEKEHYPIYDSELKEWRNIENDFDKTEWIWEK